MPREPLLDVSVVLPTYNESASLPLLIPRILDALRAAGRSLTAAEVLEIVNADGGRTVALGSIRNALSQLANQGQAVRTEHGHYTIPQEGDNK